MTAAVSSNETMETEMMIDRGLAAASRAFRIIAMSHGAAICAATSEPSRDSSLANWLPSDHPIGVGAIITPVFIEHPKDLSDRTFRPSSSTIRRNARGKTMGDITTRQASRFSSAPLCKRPVTRENAKPEAQCPTLQGRTSRIGVAVRPSIAENVLLAGAATSSRSGSFLGSANTSSAAP
jgi:hypothetical protein